MTGLAGLSDLQFEPHERVGALGGTFDPLHRAHLHLADAAAQALELDRLILIPAGEPWRKHDRAVTPAAHRLAMTVEAARARRGGLEVSDIEVRRDGPTYTLDTVRELRDRGANQLWWIMGGRRRDRPPALAPTERNPDLRPDREPPSGPAQSSNAANSTALCPDSAAGSTGLPMEPIGLSASDIRDRIRQGDDVSEDVPASVLDYVREHRLYL